MNNQEPTTGAKFRYLGGVFTINAVYQNTGWMYFTDPKGEIGEMQITDFKRLLRDGQYEFVTE
jgi:hypothetical protein